MGRFDGHARRRRPALVALVHLLLAALHPSASSAKLPLPCPAFCVCNVTVELFFMVTCVRASLHDVPRELPRRENTMVLDLQQNELQKLRESALDGFTQLQFLYLNHSQLKEISEKAFRQCTELRSVFLSGNDLTQLPSRLFESNHRLQFVDLSGNPLFLPTKGPFLISRSLLILNLTATRLSEVPLESFTRLRQLKLVDLRANLLKGVELGAVDFLRNTTLLLQYNPLFCDCSLWLTWRWLQDNAPPSSPTKLQEDSPMCNDPKSLSDTPLDVMVNRLSCDVSSKGGLTTGMYVAIGVTAFLAVVVVSLTAVTAVRWSKRKRGATEGGPRGYWCRPKRLAPPVGEYIEVVPDNTMTKKPVEEVDGIYASMEETKPTMTRAPESDGSAVATRNTNDERYVCEFTRCTYVPPSAPPREEEPLYVNMKGPPLPERGCSNADPTAARALPPPPRPCSVPLLEGCDFYEVVD